MTDLVTVITCTGYRSGAFALCKQFIERQTYKGQIQWIVVHDQKGILPLTSDKKNIAVEVHRGPKVWEEGYNTQRGNMELALEKVKGDIVFVMEDDDYYKPNYISYMVKLLDVSDTLAAGIASARYYNVNIPGFKIMNNLKHASLSQTVFKKELLPLFTKAVNSGSLYFDIEFWKSLQLKEHPNVLVEHTNLSIGIKGMPGKSGITESHRVYRDYQYDAGMKVLKDWLGEKDLVLYSNFIKQRKEPTHATNS